MPEETKKEEKPDSRAEQLKDLKDKIKDKKQTDTQTIIKQVATREKLERDYIEDILEVSFNSSPETKRMIKAKRPTQSEMMTIMRLSAEAAIYEGKMDPSSLEKMVNIYDNLP